MHHLLLTTSLSQYPDLCALCLVSPLLPLITMATKLSVLGALFCFPAASEQLGKQTAAGQSSEQCWEHHHSVSQSFRIPVIIGLALLLHSRQKWTEEILASLH